jgi:nucleoside diphosphate kinase
MLDFYLSHKDKAIYKKQIIYVTKKKKSVFVIHTQKILEKYMMNKIINQVINILVG